MIPPACPATPSRPSISISYTTVCNIACAHCSVHGGPARKGCLGVETASECVRQAADAGVRIVSFTGGECTLFMDDLLAIMAAGQEKGVTYSLTTNAHWARGPDEARAVVERLRDAGLEHLRISADAFHQRFIPLRHVTWAIEAALSARIAVKVDAVVRRRDPVTAQIVSALRRYPILVELQPLVGQGRALEALAPEDFPSTSTSAVAPVGCVKSGQVFVTDTGDAFSCCNASSVAEEDRRSYRTLAFHLGDVRVRGIASVLDAASRSDVIRTIRDSGPFGLFSKYRAIAPGLRDREFPHGTSVCAACRRVVAWLGPEYGVGDAGDRATPDALGERR